MLPFGVELNNVHCLQLLEDVTGNASAAFAKVRWATTVPLAATIDSTESTNTKSSPKVNLPSHRCCIRKTFSQIKKNLICIEKYTNQRERELTSSDVVPIRIIWGKLLQLSGLHNVCPCGKLDLKQTKDITLWSRENHKQEIPNNQSCLSTMVKSGSSTFNHCTCQSKLIQQSQSH